MSPRVRTGLERLCAEEARLVRGRRIGLLAHPASVTARLEPAADALARAGATIAVRFGPEHGLGGEAQDMEGVGSPSPPAAGPASHSLYGDTFASLSPQPAWLRGLDAVVIDLQDVGSRYYTFVWTAVLMARACAAPGIPVLVCDRPDPLGGLLVEGPPPLADQCSFVGLRPVPVRHGLTVGEIVREAARAEGLAHVTVVPMEGWRRAMQWEDTGLPWVLPSPNMPTPDTARVYPGGCLVEGTNLSEGRGTTRPFELVGAPFVAGAALARALARDAGAGCVARPLDFRPTFHKHAGRTCGGVQVHITDPQRFRPWRCYLALLAAVRRAPGFAWRTERYEFVDDRPAIDLLTGDPAVRAAIDAGATIEDLVGLGRDRAQAWDEGLRARWLYADG